MLGIAAASVPAAAPIHDTTMLCVAPATEERDAADIAAYTANNNALKSELEGAVQAARESKVAEVYMVVGGQITGGGRLGAADQEDSGLELIRAVNVAKQGMERREGKGLGFERQNNTSLPRRAPSTR